MTSDTHIFVQFAEDQKKPLQRADVAFQDESRYILRFDSAINAKAEEPVTIFQQIGRRFHRQPCRVESVCEISSSESLVKLIRTGEPAPAESRTAFRAVTVGRDIIATIDDHHRGEVVNISAHGLAVLLDEVPPSGRMLRIMIHAEGTVIRGRCELKSRTKVNARQYKCGFEAHDERLVHFLGRLCTTVQREQLRRLARTR